ncbi:hypothetical protein C8R42DRAFT_727145 [Lentinula raphanica]|nr:hypothetical protein C8R42DRAFT_727145 [Lentinula raphanica]
MASSSKGSSSKRPLPKLTTTPSTVPYPRKKLSVRPVDTLDLDAVHHVHFDRSVRELGQVANDSDALFLPASAEECSILVNRWKHKPNNASPAFSLRRYSHPEDVDFKELLDQVSGETPLQTFYPSQLTSFCTTFATGSVSTGEAFQLYQALAFLQRGFSRIIRGHLAKSEIHRRLLKFTSLPNFSHSLQYYQLFWHGHSNCPLVAPLLVILICEFCEEHLSEAEYAERVYDARIRDGPGMSLKTRDRLLEDITEIFELQDLALPIPFDSLTREGQLILTVASQGSRVDQIVHPASKRALLPDPAFAVPLPAPQASSSSVPKRRLRPLSPDFDQPIGQPLTTNSPQSRRPPAKFPVTPDPIVEDVEEEDLTATDVFKDSGTPDVLVIRPSIARAAKAKPKIPEEFRKVPAPSSVHKREHSPPSIALSSSTAAPPTKKRRTQKSAGKARAESLVPALEESSPKDEEPFRIQEGEPDYFTGDDSRTSTHARFLTNPNFKPKAPFSELIRKTVAQNPRAPKLPFLRRPKWKLSDEMKNFGAFINSADTSFSLQGLSRYNYLASRPLQSSTSTTLPSPEALLSPNNCLSCLSRGVVCEGGTKIGGPCGHCDRTHRNCPSCLGLDEHRDRFLAIHNTIQGYPAGYSGSLERFRDTLEEMGHIMSSFETIFGDVRRRLALNLQDIRTNGFDFNVVLSKWADDNPNLPLDYDLLTWLATFFGWDSACNLSSFLVDPNDTARLEEFLRSNEFPADDSTGPSIPALVTTSVADPSSAPRSPPVATLLPPEPILRSRRRPAAAVPSNYSSESKFHTPPASTTADDEMDVEEGTSRTSVAQALVAEHDDSEEEEIAGDDTDEDVPVELEPPTTLRSPQSRK